MKQTVAHELQILRTRRNQKELVSYGGLLVTRAARERLQNHFCGGCGREKVRPKLYFGEEFCGDCVEKFCAGK